MDQISGARRPSLQSAVDWRIFLRAMAEEIDSLAGSGERDDMLRGVGRRMARLHPLSAVQSLEALEMEANDVLDGFGWGQVQFRLNEPARSLDIVHKGLPRIGSLGHPAGQWLSALLEGLYDGWFSQQAGNKPSLSARRSGGSAHDTIVMSYLKR